MAERKDEKKAGQEYSVDEILAEYGSSRVVEFPERDRTAPPAEDRPSAPDGPRQEPPREPQPMDEIVPPTVGRKLAARLSTLRRRADHYADHMYDQAEPDEETKLAEKYIPGVDREERAMTLARRCAQENGLADRATFETLDLRDLRGRLPAGGFDLVVSNPPYFPPSRGLSPADPARRQARTEDTLSLPELCQAAAYLLRWGGGFCLVHRPERLADLLTALREAGLEPKRLRAVESRPGAAPSLLLLEARRGGKPGLSWEAPLRLTDASGAPTPELDAIYFRSTEDTIL